MARRALLLGLVSGCSKTAIAPQQPRDAPTPERAPASAFTSASMPPESIGVPLPSFEARSAAAVGPEIIVGSERGLEAWRRDGGARRLVSRGPARAPRWLDAQSLLVLSALDTENAIRMERISIDDGERVLVSTIPSFACKEGASSVNGALALQMELDFVVDAPKKAACLTLMDRNLNMRDVTLEVLVQLESGTVKRWLDTASACRLPKGVARGEIPDSLTCARRPAASQPPTTFPFDFSGDTVIRNETAGARAVLRVRDYSAATYSPSGRWLVLDGDVEEGDYIHRRVVLLDRTTGDVFALPKSEGTELRRLDPSRKTSPPSIATPIENTFEAVGETTVRWLGTNEADELLVLDDLVLRPQRKAFSVNGEVAR